VYREWKEIELCWFGYVQVMEGCRILLVLGCTESGRKLNFVGLGMYREWKEMELCWFGDVQRMERNGIFFFGDVQKTKGIRIVLVWGCTGNGRMMNCVVLGM
jgi:hypothetical protein